MSWYDVIQKWFQISYSIIKCEIIKKILLDNMIQQNNIYVAKTSILQYDVNTYNNTQHDII